MRNLKKFLAVLLTVVLMVTAIVPAFAAEAANASDVEIAMGLNVLRGNGKADYLTTNTLRYQALRMQLRLQGLEEEAMEWEIGENFADANEVSGVNQNILAYAYENPEAGWDGSTLADGTRVFRPMAAVSAKELYKTLLVALGYEYNVDFDWNGVEELAEEVGFVALLGQKTLTNADFATAAVEALKAEMADGTLFVEYLAEIGVIDFDAAVEFGLIEVEEEEDPQVEIVAAAEEAVAAAEAATVETAEDVVAAEALVAAAEEAVAEVEDADVKAEFEARIEAVNAKIEEAKVALTKIEILEVKAVNSKTLGVVFNKELSAKEKEATFVVRYTNNVIAVKPVVWDGKVAKFERSDSGKLNAGSYTVTFGEITASGTVAAEAATSMAITSERVSKAASVAVSYAVYNQYAEEMVGVPVTVVATNMSDPTRTVSGTLAALNTSLANVGDVIRLTAYVTAIPTINTVKNITISNIYIESVSLAQPVLPENVTRFVQGQTNVTIAPTVTDNFGANAVLTAGAIANGATRDGFVVTYNNITAVTVLADGKIQFTLGAPGAASITFTSLATGTSVSQGMMVVASPDTARIVLSNPAANVRVATTRKVPYVAYDQYEAALTTAAPWAPSDVTLSTSNPAVATVAWNGNDIEVTGVSEGTAIIYANVVTGVANPATAVATLQINVLSAPVITSVSINGTPKTLLANGQTVLGTAESGALKFNITDQDGNAVNLNAAGANAYLLNISVANSVANVLTTPTTDTVLTAANMSATTGLTNGITVTAGAIGTSTITAQLFRDADGDGVMDPGEGIASTAIVTYTVTAPVLTNGVVSSIASVAGTPVTLAANADNTAAYSNYAGTNGTVRLTYQFKDQADNNFTAAAATNVAWTIKNNGAAAITINDGEVKTLAAGATATYTTQGTTTATIDIINTANELKVDVSVAAAGVATPDTTVIYYTEQIVSAGQTFTGTVIAKDDAANWVILQTSVGYVVSNFGAGHTFTVDGSTATIAQFKANLTVGDAIVVVHAGVVALTNR